MSTENHRNCMSDRIRDALLSRILEGSLQPGDRLVELDLAKQFDTSQTPIREALRELETLRMVESVPYRGTRVRAISDREMVEAYDVRGVLEQFAAELAAPRFLGNTADLRASVAALREAAMTGDIAGYCKHNMDFHRRIVQQSDNELLIQTWQSLAFEARVRIHLTRVNTPNLVDRADEHSPIIDAFDAADGALAGKLLREHAESCRTRWMQRDRSLDEVQDQPQEQSHLVQAGVLS